MLQETEKAADTATDTAPSTGPRKVVKKAAKKAAKKSTVKKVTKKANGNGADAGTSLATIAKSLKMPSRKARRILRGAEGVPEATDTRWTWTKAADVAKVKKILTDATKDD